MNQWKLSLNRQTSGHLPVLRRGMSGFSFVLGSILWLMVLVAVWVVVSRRAQKAPDPVASEADPAEDAETVDETPKSLVIKFPARELPEFEFPECMGGTIARESLRGKRWLANFVFTRCVETCPVITRHVSELHTSVAKSNPDFVFVTFSVDSSFDSAEVLQKYSDTFRADHERWKFLTGDENEIHDLIRRGFAQFVQANLGEMRKPGFEVAHSNRAVLVNEDCIPVATYLMTDPEDVVRLRRVIEGKSEFPEPGPALTITSPNGENPSIQLNVVPVAEEPTHPPDSEAGGSSETPEQSEGKEDSPSPGASDSPKDDADGNPDGASSSAESRNEKINQNLPGWVSVLPAVNATLNSLCTILLVAGFVAIRCGKRIFHRNLMVTAFVVSVVFLGCYLTYHEALYHFTGERGRAFVGSGLATLVYRSILIPHVILAVFVPILAIRVFVHAWRERWSEHRWLARITLPIWLFVSITGVIIYWMLYHWPWRDVPASVAMSA